MTQLPRPVVALLSAVALGTVLAPAPAQATDTIGYGYTFSDVRTGYGPCADGNARVSVGDVGPAGFVWQRKTREKSFGPNVKVEYRTENAFRKTITSRYCKNSYPYRMVAGHGSYKVSRVNEYHKTCYADNRCQFIGYYQKPWLAGWR